MLSNGKVDVVDHDVDIMVGTTSEAEWLKVRFALNQKLRDRGWDVCFGRTSVDAPDESMAFKLAREDLLLCTRQNPSMSLDVASYIIGNGKIYAQKFCDDKGCYLPRVGTLRLAKGYLRSSTVYPLQRCKLGDHDAVPCPRKPLEVLKVTMPGWNFTEHCMALPDVAKRQQRGYSSDAVWMDEALSAEDVKILQRRAVELEMEGFMSMAPYFSTCSQR